MAEKRAPRAAMGIPDRRPPATCRGCASRWSGTQRAHCSACHLTFSSASAFDRHRTPDGEHGHCLDPITLTGSSLLVRRNGVWSWPPMPDNTRRTFGHTTI